MFLHIWNTLYTRVPVHGRKKISPIANGLIGTLDRVITMQRRVYE